MKWLVIFMFGFYSSFSFSKVTKIIVWESLYNNPTPIAMNYLQKALALTTEEYGDYQLIESMKMEQGRSLIELEKKSNSTLDIALYASTIEREEKAIAIRIPVLSGLLGYRLCLIDAKNQATFQGVKSKKQLIDKDISIGQHKDWPDTTILRFNDIAVQTTHKKELLFQQLSRGRFDCFSRGASEIYAEYLEHKSENIVIEKELLIYYPLPVFFFVNKSRPLLAERLQLGLQRLIESGDFDDEFEEVFFPIIDKLKLSDRTVIDLHNPTLSQKTIESLAAPTQRFREKNLNK